MVEERTAASAGPRSDGPTPDAQAAVTALLFDALPDGVWVTDGAGVVIYMNPAARTLLELTPDAAPADAVPPFAELRDADGQSLAPESSPLARALRGEAASNLPFVLPRAAADDLHLGVSFAPMRRQPDGAITGAVILAGDRTAEHRIERVRDDFLATISHDLRSPLTTIRGSAQLALRWARREGAVGESLQHTLANIDAAAGRLNRMLETLLDSARLARGGLALQRAPSDLVALVEEVVEHHRRESPRHRFVIEKPDEPLIGDWDAALLERAIENLVGNAVKYSPQGGEVRVTCAGEEARVRLSVRDQGVGIPAAALPYIFNQFYRAKNASFGEIEGTGLGLFAVKGIITAHGGTIEVASVEGEGTEMTVRLPRAAQEETA